MREVTYSKETRVKNSKKGMLLMLLSCDNFISFTKYRRSTVKRSRSHVPYSTSREMTQKSKMNLNYQGLQNSKRGMLLYCTVLYLSCDNFIWLKKYRRSTVKRSRRVTFCTTTPLEVSLRLYGTTVECYVKKRHMTLTLRRTYEYYQYIISR